MLHSLRESSECIIIFFCKIQNTRLGGRKSKLNHCNRATQKRRRKTRQMEVTVRGFDDNSYVIEVGEDDTTETMRQKVASAAGLAEDSFHMGFGGKDEGEDITQLSAGDTIVLTKTSMKYAAIAALHALGETDLTPERLKKVEDPEVACLLLQAEVATVIPNRFLVGGSLTRLDLSAHCDTDWRRVPVPLLHGNKY